jgi:ATP-dependent helicase HrpB
VLAGFPDRVGRRRNEREVQLANGRSAALSNAPEFLVALDIEERSDQPLPIVRLAAPIKPDWLLDLYPERIRERTELVWNRTAERVEASSAMLYDELVIDETRGALPDPEAAGRLLAERAMEAGLHRFTDPEEVEALLARTAFASEHARVATLSDADVQSTLTELATGLRSFSELRSLTENGGLIRALKSRLDERLIEEVAPERIRIGPRRQAKVHYPRGQPPWVESRLQDFFGQRETPRVARGAVPLVVKLLAPNNRPVQTTTDLAGFWQRLYPQVRRELSRRYPKHAWPEDPLA